MDMAKGLASRPKTKKKKPTDPEEKLEQNSSRVYASGSPAISMRTELALAALGFVSVISLSSILSKYALHDHKKILLDTVTGSVCWGNFSYWKLTQPGPLLLELTSLQGDADLYVSEHERPSYEVEHNNFSSVTCGLDSVHVPAVFPRPIGIGVFGHWSHETSGYLMNVYLDAEEMQLTDPFAGTEIPLEREAQWSGRDRAQWAGRDRAQGAGRDRAHGTGRERAQGAGRTSDSPLLLGLLSMLDVLVEMFIV